MRITKIKSRVINPPKDEIWDVLDTLELIDGDIVFITSKILAIHEGRCVPMSGANKDELIKQEATHWMENDKKDMPVLTITQNTLIPSAGIDESNANGHYILWPKFADRLCQDIRSYLMKKNRISKLGVVATDSKTTPLRMGVTGIAIGLAGVNPIKDLRGVPDIFGKKLQHTRVNLIDPIAGLAVLLMGESTEKTPMIVVSGYTEAQFNDKATMDDLRISPKEDMYQPLMEAFTTN